MTARLMAEMTWPEVHDAAKEDLPAVLAVGSTEQHGPHLPLATDTIIPVAIATEAADRVPLVIAPPVHLGAHSRPLSGGGQSFPGTVSLRATTLMKMLEEVLLELARSGFRRVCVQNWHYENAGFLWEACDLAAKSASELRILLLEDPMPRFTDAELETLFPGGFGGWDVEHASIMETSMMMAIRPDLVRTDRIADDQAERHPSWDVIPAPDEFISASGVLWYPTGSSAALGQRFLDAAATRLIEALTTEFGPPGVPSAYAVR